MSKVKKFILPVLMVLVTVLSGLAPATNASAQVNKDSDFRYVNGLAAENKIAAAVSFVEDGEGIVVSSSDLDMENAAVYNVGGGVAVVTLGLTGEYSMPSNITLFFDKNNKVLQTNEMLVTKNELGNFQVSTHMNGVLIKSQDSGVAFMTDEELLAEEPVTIQPAGVKEVAACIGVVLGVGSTIAYLMTLACGGSCAAPTPVTVVICAACIGGYALVGGKALDNVVACFDKL